MSARDLKGQAINLGDQVSIIGVVSSVGTGNNPSVVVQPPLSPTTFTANAQDLRCKEHSSPGPVYGNSIAAGDDCTTLGTVTAISGSGNTATLTVLLAVSQLSISVPAGACYGTGA